MTVKVVSQGLMDMDELIKNAVKIRKVGEDEGIDLGFDISMIQRDETTLLQMEESKMDFSMWKDEENEEENICQELQEFFIDLEAKLPDSTPGVDRIMHRLNQLDQQDDEN